MKKEHERELEKPESWDFEQPEIRGPVKASRVVISVAFRRDDFDQVSKYAERVGKRVSEFIREAAIEKATGRGTGTLVYASGSTGTLWAIEQMPTISRVSGSQVEQPEKEPATTHG
ncbi:MAG: hypothetical protein HYY01_15800 [Chloroflexi bacterium]|nr:hypothetical protein [Chloroflexota bacterium]